MSMVNFRKLFSALIALVLAVSLCAAVSEPSYASSAPSVSRSSAVVAKGKTVKITVKNPDAKVKWKSSDKGVAYVKTTKGKKGQIAIVKAGKRAGVCKITAKVGTRKLTCRVVRLNASTKDVSDSVKAGKAENLGASAKFKNSAADFSFELLRNTVEADSEKGKSVNMLISPDSILSALVMTENGAKGETLREMQKALSGGISVSDYNRYLSGLNHRLTSSKSVKFSTANSIWARKGKIQLRKSFLKKNKTYHKAQVFEAAFNGKTVKDMNNWVLANTDGMIKQIISQLMPDDRVVLINAIAFTGSWEEKFSEPVKREFTPEGGSVKETNTLCERSPMEYMSVNGGKGFVKYYRGREIAFAGLLPPEGVSADEYLSGISGKEFISAWNSKKFATLDISVPQFKYDYDTSMRNPLYKMGMKKAFGNDANFSGMFVSSRTSPGIHIDDVIHKTHIELDMNGTKAAAATAVVMKASSIMHEEEVIEIHLDRPFIYALVDTKTGIPLFAGILRDVG